MQGQADRQAEGTQDPNLAGACSVISVSISKPEDIASRRSGWDAIRRVAEYRPARSEPAGQSPHPIAHRRVQRFLDYRAALGLDSSAAVPTFEIPKAQHRHPSCL